MVDEVTIIDEIHRLADVNPRRPTRNVACYSLPAVEDVELVSPGLPLRDSICAGEQEQCSNRGSEQSQSSHRFLRSAWPLTVIVPSAKQAADRADRPQSWFA